MCVLNEFDKHKSANSWIEGILRIYIKLRKLKNIKKNLKIITNFSYFNQHISYMSMSPFMGKFNIFSFSMLN